MRFNWSLINDNITDADKLAVINFLSQKNVRLTQGEKVKEFEKQYPNLVVVTIEKHINQRPGKKFALTLGIKTAKHEHLLLTDADCLPNSKNWAMQMCSNFNSADIVLGYGGYEKKKGLLNKLIRFDTFGYNLIIEIVIIHLSIIISITRCSFEYVHINPSILYPIGKRTDNTKYLIIHTTLTTNLTR